MLGWTALTLGLLLLSFRLFNLGANSALSQTKRNLSSIGFGISLIGLGYLVYWLILQTIRLGKAGTITEAVSLSGQITLPGGLALIAIGGLLIFRTTPGWLPKLGAFLGVIGLLALVYFAGAIRY